MDTTKTSELLECFDNNGKTIQSKSRDEVHAKPYTIWHGVASVWLLNNKGEILCFMRADWIDGNPNKWQTYIGGHVKAGSDFLKTALIEVAEEIGLKAREEDFKLVDLGKREDVMHFYKMYAILFNDDLSKLHFTDGEVAGVKWFSFEDYEKEKEKNPDQWCNSMKIDQYKKAIEELNISKGKI